MQVDISSQNIISSLGILLTFIMALIGVWWKFEVRIRDIESKALDAARGAEKQLNDFKLHVTQEYASWDTVRLIEDRLTKRIDLVSEQIMKLPDTVVERLSKLVKG